MLQSWRLKRKVRRAKASIAGDPLQPAGAKEWLDTLERGSDLAACPEPGWYVHLAFWSDSPIESLLGAALHAAEVVLVGSRAPYRDIGRELISESQWARLRQAAASTSADEFADKHELYSLIAQNEAALAKTLQDYATDGRALEHVNVTTEPFVVVEDLAGLSGSQTHGLHAARYAKLAEDLNDETERAAEVRVSTAAAAALLAYGAIFRENGQREDVALASARAVALLGRHSHLANGAVAKCVAEVLSLRL